MRLAHFLWFTLLIFFSAQLLAQSSKRTNEVAGKDRTAVIRPIAKLFAGMLAADTTGLSGIFHPTARIMSVATDENGTVGLNPADVNGFMTSITTSSAGQLREELGYTELRINGPLATAWTPYTFYYNGQLSHCGVNAFQLAKTGQGGSWQIIRVTDTRSREGCPTNINPDPLVSLDSFATRWHRAAAETDAELFFGSMHEDAIYIGTDAGEHWTKAEFYSFAKPYFDQGKAWDFTAKERHIFIDPDENIAYWDELLNTWMGPCRGTGIAKRQLDGSWKLLHYTLSVTVANEKIEDFIRLSKQ